jgi:hypothetical protein
MIPDLPDYHSRRVRGNYIGELLSFSDRLGREIIAIIEKSIFLLVTCCPLDYKSWIIPGNMAVPRSISR